MALVSPGLRNEGAVMNAADLRYLRLAKDVLAGARTEDRTGVGTVSMFGAMAKHHLGCYGGPSRPADQYWGSLPILGSKDVNWRAAIGEMLWFMAGHTNIKDLNSKIWDPWADHNGELGPIYGAQWRAFNGGVCPDGRRRMDEADQLKRVIFGLKNDPLSRRHLVSAWNPLELSDMALPPCHVMFQFNVTPSRILNMAMYQRSADVALGVPFNWIGYSFLLHAVANECGLTPGVFTHMMGDVHIYKNHVEVITEQLAAIHAEEHFDRIPVLVLPLGKPALELTLDDVEVHYYTPGPKLKYEVAV